MQRCTGFLVVLLIRLPFDLPPDLQLNPLELIDTFSVNYITRPSIPPIHTAEHCQVNRKPIVETDPIVACVELPLTLTSALIREKNQPHTAYPNDTSINKTWPDFLLFGIVFALSKFSHIFSIVVSTLSRDNNSTVQICPSWNSSARASRGSLAARMRSTLTRIRARCAMISTSSTGRIDSRVLLPRLLVM